MGSSSSLSRMLRSPRAPVSSAMARLAIARSPLSVKCSTTSFSMRSILRYCRATAFLGWTNTCGLTPEKGGRLRVELKKKLVSEGL